MLKYFFDKDTIQVGVVSTVGLTLSFTLAEIIIRCLVGLATLTFILYKLYHLIKNNGKE